MMQNLTVAQKVWLDSQVQAMSATDKSRFSNLIDDLIDTINTNRQNAKMSIDIRDLGAKCDGGSSETGTINSSAVVSDPTPPSGMLPFNGQPITFVGAGSAIGGGITNVTKAAGSNPVITTASAHGLANGAQVTISGVGGATQVNGVWAVTGVTSTTFQVRLNINTIGTFTSGGTVTPTKTVFGYVDDVFLIGGTLTFKIKNAPKDGSIVTVPGGMSTGMYYFGSDDTQAWKDAVAQANTVGILSPNPVAVTWSGVSMVSDTIIVDGNVMIVGDGMEYVNPDGLNSFSNIPARGSILRPHGNFNGASNVASVLLQLGVAVSTHSGDQGSSTHYGTFDAANIVANALQTSGSRNFVERSYALNGTSHAINSLGSNSWFIHAIAGQANTGDGVYIANSDFKWYGGFVRQCTNAFRIASGSDISIGGGVHIFNGYNGGNEQYGSDVLIDASTNNVYLVQLGDIVYDGVIGPQIRIVPAASKKVQHVSVRGGLWFQPQSFGDLYAPMVQLDLTAAGSQITDVLIEGYMAKGQNSTARYKSIVDTIAGTTSNCQRINLGNGNAYWCAEHYTGQRPQYVSGGGIIYDGTSTQTSGIESTVSFTGNGAATTFIVAHGLSQAPVAITSTPMTSASVGAWATVDATNITFTFATAPANSAALQFGYRANI